jgi:hypothetical protein
MHSIRQRRAGYKAFVSFGQRLAAPTNALSEVKVRVP